MSGQPKTDLTQANIAENFSNWRDSRYYDLAERDIGYQWDQVIWPILRGFDLSITLELAPGHGRNTQHLLKFAREMHLVDLAPECIDFCKRRFGMNQGDTQMHYYVNDGKSLPSSLTGGVTSVYCWDAMVHFEFGVIERYLHSIARVLRIGGQAFLHHSDLKSDPTLKLGSWTQNPHWRSAVSKQEVAAAATAHGLTLISQTPVPWGDGVIHDCITVLRR